MGQVLTTEEIIAAYDAVTVRDVGELAREVLDFDRMSLSAVGRVRSEEDYREMMCLA